MPLFICEKCDAIDNTACGGTFWLKDMDLFKADANGKALCCECAPTEFKDGSKNDRAGKWHDLFPKEFATQDMVDNMTEERRQHFVGFGRFA